MHASDPLKYLIVAYIWFKSQFSKWTHAHAHTQNAFKSMFAHFDVFHETFSNATIFDLNIYCGS